jgi:hypothetical protein
MNEGTPSDAAAPAAASPTKPLGDGWASTKARRKVAACVLGCLRCGPHWSREISPSALPRCDPGLIPASLTLLANDLGNFGPVPAQFLSDYAHSRDQFICRPDCSPFWLAWHRLRETGRQERSFRFSEYKVSSPCI